MDNMEFDKLIEDTDCEVCGKAITRESSLNSCDSCGCDVCYLCTQEPFHELYLCNNCFLEKEKELKDRLYIAVSIKHTEKGFKFGNPMKLWGYRRTKNFEGRCFGLYTESPFTCEVYTEKEFNSRCGNTPVVEINTKMIRENIDKDTVLVKLSDYLSYCKMFCLDYKE